MCLACLKPKVGQTCDRPGSPSQDLHIKALSALGIRAAGRVDKRVLPPEERGRARLVPLNDSNIVPRGLKGVALLLQASKPDSSQPALKVWTIWNGALQQQAPGHPGDPEIQVAGRKGGASSLGNVVRGCSTAV